MSRKEQIKQNMLNRARIEGAEKIKSGKISVNEFNFVIEGFEEDLMFRRGS